MWDPRIFCFSPQVRRKGADGCRFYSFTNFSLVLLVVHIIIFIFLFLFQFNVFHKKRFNSLLRFHKINRLIKIF
jgi:hypothetical protein